MSLSQCLGCPFKNSCSSCKILMPMTCTKKNSNHQYCRACFEACPLDIQEYSNNCIICERLRSRIVLNEIQLTVHRDWKQNNALRITQSFEIAEWNQIFMFWTGEIVYFVNRHQDSDHRNMIFVCFWDKDKNDPSDIPNNFSMPEDILDRASDVPDRETCNLRFNFNTRKNIRDQQHK